MSRRSRSAAEALGFVMRERFRSELRRDKLRDA
jgi:hypothetical protein